ncbi:MAG: hypothetical protein AAF609_18510 [Cyanobacteria bacterium P01_C01_bin.120]
MTFKFQATFLEPEKVTGAGAIEHVEEFEGESTGAIRSHAENYAKFRGWVLDRFTLVSIENNQKSKND